MFKHVSPDGTVAHQNVGVFLMELEQEYELDHQQVEVMRAALCGNKTVQEALALAKKKED